MMDRSLPLIPRWMGFVLALAALVLAVLLVSGAAQAGTSPVRGPGGGFLDGGGFPTATLTPTLPPTAAPTNTSAPFIYPVESPTLPVLQPQSDFIPGAQEAEPVAQTSPNLLMLCLPFGVVFLIVIALLATWLRRRGHTP